MRLSLLALLPCAALAAEADYQQPWCAAHGGTIPRTALADGTFPDCLTARHAIEFDFGHKWAEALGQALNYASYTGKRAGIVLIVEEPRDWRGVERVRKIIDHFGLPVTLLEVMEK